jgi:hypothetical protein
MSLFSFVLVHHFGLACGAALLFLMGVLLAFPVVKLGAAPLTWLPRVLFGMVRRLLGGQPSMARLGSVIFGFNGSAMLLYMASGVHPGIPAAISVLTGYNIAVILLLSGEANGLAITPAAHWKPARWVAGLCGLAVVFLELPCFWYSIAMGIGLGQEVVAGRTGYLEAFSFRLYAYVVLILPVLLVSALCEAIAIQGMAASPPDEATPPQDSGFRDQGPGHPARPPDSSGGGMRP